MATVWQHTMVWRVSSMKFRGCVALCVPSYGLLISPHQSRLDALRQEFLPTCGHLADHGHATN